MERILAIAKTTFRESVRGKVLYSVLFASLLVEAVSSLFGNVTIGDQVKVIKDFGLLAVSLLSVGFCVVAGAALLHKELSRKTVYNILAKPVHRAEFLLGKYFGMVSTTAVLIALMGSCLSLYTAPFEGRLDPAMLQAYYYIFLELVVVCAAAIFFSALVVTPLLSGLFTLGVFIAGRSSAYILKFAELSGQPFPKTVYHLLPHLDSLNVGNAVVYGELAPASHVAWSTLYAATYAGVLLVLASLAFSRRHFN